LSTWYERTRLRLYLRVPSWQSECDGSLVTGAKVAESPRAGTIPELLLKVNAHSGSGIPGQGRRNQPPLRLRWHRPWPARAPDSTAEVRYKGIYVFWNARPDRRNATTTGPGLPREDALAPRGRLASRPLRDRRASRASRGSDRRGPGGRDRRVLRRRAPRHQHRIGRAGQVRAIEGRYSKRALSVGDQGLGERANVSAGVVGFSSGYP
jgi:hypothetical protein